MWKKLGLTAFILVGALGMAPISVQGNNIVPANQVYNSAPMDGYPCIGGDDTTLYYLDPSSCYGDSDGRVATLSAIYYGYNSGKMTPYTAVFKSTKQNGQRRIMIDRITIGRRNVTDQVLQNDRGFLKALFWTIADYTGMAESLD